MQTACICVYKLHLCAQVEHHSSTCEDRVCKKSLRVHTPQEKYCLQIKGEMENMLVKSTKDYCTLLKKETHSHSWVKFIFWFSFSEKSTDVCNWLQVCQCRSSIYGALKCNIQDKTCIYILTSLLVVTAQEMFSHLKITIIAIMTTLWGHSRFLIFL